MRRVMRRVTTLATLTALVACAGAAPATRPAPAHADTLPSARAVVRDDSTNRGLIPSGYGSLRQDEVAIRVQTTSLVVRAIPLDESVIRTLSPDSYRALHDLLASRRVQ